MECPGQNSGYWTGERVVEVPCPACGSVVEIFRDETAGRCRRCGQHFFNPGANFACAQWCSLAKECLGFAPQRPPPTNSTESALAARLIQWIERRFKHDPVQIAHALRVFQHAKELVRQEGANPCVVLSASLLVAVDTDQTAGAERATCQPADMSRMEEALASMGLDPGTCEQIRRLIVSYQRGEDVDTLEFRMICDSNTLAKLTAQHFHGTPDDLEDIIRNSLRTETARNRARSLLHT